MKAEPFETGVVTISLDTELGWGRVQRGAFEDTAARLDETKQGIRSLLDVFERHRTPATWAVVGQLCRRDPSSPPDTGEVSVVPDGTTIPWERDWWHAPDLVDAITASPVDHELASHSGNHVRYDGVSRETVEHDLRCVEQWCGGESMRSFVFPENGVAHLDALAAHGFECYRGRPPVLGSDPSPTAFRPRRVAGLVNVPGCVALRHYDGRHWVLRRTPLGVKRASLAAGLHHARLRGRVFHLILHPSDFTLEDGADLLATLDSFLGTVARLRDRGGIDVLTMGDVARRATFPE